MLEARPITSPARFALYLDLSSYPIFEAAIWKAQSLHLSYKRRYGRIFVIFVYCYCYRKGSQVIKKYRMCVMFLLCHSFTWKVSYNSFKVFPSHWEGNILSCQGVRGFETIICFKFRTDRWPLLSIWCCYLSI